MGDDNVLSPDYNADNQPQPTVVSQPTAAPDPSAALAAGPIASRGSLPVMPAPQPQVQAPPPTGMSPLQLALRGALSGFAAGMSQRTVGQGVAAGANAGTQVAQQNDADQAAKEQAAQQKQEADDRHAMVLANLQLHNIQMMGAMQQVKNGTLEYYSNLAKGTDAAISASQEADGSQVYGTNMPEDVVKQKYLELHQQNPQSRVTYGVDGSTTDAQGNLVPTFSLYDPGTGMVTLSPEKLQQLKDAGIKVPTNVPANSQVSPTVLNNWRSQSVQAMAMQKAKAETDTATANATSAQANATTAQANAAVAPQMAQANLQNKQLENKEGNARIGLIKAQTSNQYAEAVKNRLMVSNAADAKMYDTGINPVTKQKLTLDNAPDEMLVDSNTGQPIPFKMLSTLKPTSQEINRADFAKSTLHSLEQLDGLMAAGKLPNGPLSGLTTKALTKAGLSSGDAQKAMDFISFAQSAATGAHVGGRFNVPIMQKMGDMININMNTDQFKGAESAIRDVMTQYAQQGGRMTVGQYKQQLQQPQTVTPQSHAFSVSAWQRANPNGDVNAAKAAAQQQGFQVVQ